jgi:hypothetical protein
MKLLVALVLVASCGSKPPPIENRAAVQSGCPPGKIAILAIEVYPPLSAEDFHFGSDVTRALQSQPKPDEKVPDFEILNRRIDETRRGECKDDAVACMSATGAALKADRLVYGSIARTPQGYEVTLKLLYVANRTVQASVTELVPIDKPIADWARTTYGKLAAARGCR